MIDPTFPFVEGPGLEPPEEYQEIRRVGGRCPVTLGGDVPAALVTRYEDVRRVLSDPRFSRQAYAARGALFARTPESLALMQTDAPLHTRRRRAVTPYFSAARADAARPDLERMAKDLVATMVESPGSAELVEDFAVPLTLGVISDMLGVPPEDRGLFRPWVNAMMSRGAASPAEVAAGHQAMHDHFERFVDRAGSGIVADLLAAGTAGAAGATLSRDEVVVMSAGLLVAGYESTSNQLASCIYLLLAERERWVALQARPERLADAVEEMLRWTSFTTSGGTPHVAIEDVELSDQVVRAGEVVVPLTDAANRDPSVFENPDDLDLTRASRPHVAFGHGRHRCLGAELARAELQVGLSVLLRELPDLELAVAPDRVRWRREMQVSGLWELPVRWGGRR